MSDKILEARDILAAAQDYIDCICLAAETLDMRQRGPILRVADIASEKVSAAIALLQEHRDDVPRLPEGMCRPIGTL